MDIVKQYNEAKQAIYDHVGFEEDWVVYPIDDCTDKYWFVDEGSKEVHYADSPESMKEEEGYVDELYTQRFYRKWIYRGPLFTMIFCNPGVDGMKWFRVFDNSKEIDRGY